MSEKKKLTYDSICTNITLTLLFSMNTINLYGVIKGVRTLILEKKAEDITNLLSILRDYEYIESYIKKYGTVHKSKFVEEFLEKFKNERM